MPAPSFSVIIPLYNKRAEIGGTLRSVLAQTLPPREIIVVDDGSTDGGAEVVRSILAETTSGATASGAVTPDTAPAGTVAPGAAAIRLITQPNAGVCAARNRAIAQAEGEYIALLDADDEWEPGYLAEIAAMIGEFPGCGLYCTGFNVRDDKGLHPAPGLSERGIVPDFFHDSAHRYIAIPSASVIPRRVFDTVGGFPDGMKIAEDLYMWIKIARRYPVCFSPARLVRYSKTAANRSAAIYTPEHTAYSFEELYDPAAPDEEREFIARAALGKALVISAKGGTADAARAARFFSYTKVYRRTLQKVRVLNALPAGWRTPLLNAYNRAAWLIAKKGL